MAQNNFNACLNHTLDFEGGYVDHPDDPGGATNMGITHRTLASWRGVASVTKQQVKMLTRAEAAAIYKAQYWDIAQLDAFPIGLDLVVFDSNVNNGVGRSVRFLQTELKARGLYDGAIDGLVGRKTLTAIAAVNHLDGLIDAVIDRRLAFHKRLKGWATFGRGWQRRIDEVRALAHDFVEDGVAVAAVPSIARPTHLSDCRTPHDVPGACDVAASKTLEGQGAGAVGVGAAGAALSEAAQQLEPLAGFSETIRWVFIALLVGGVAITLWTNLRRVRQTNLEAA